MKKKLIALLLTASLIIPFTPVYADAKDDRIAELEAQLEEANKTIENLKQELEAAKTDTPAPNGAPVSKDGMHFSTKDFTVTYSKHEFGTDYEGKKCLLYYYTFTNTSDQNATAGISANVQCFQDGSECEMAITTEDIDAMDNYAMNEVQPGGTVEVCQAFVLKSDTELTIEVSELLSFSNEKATQTITVE